MVSEKGRLERPFLFPLYNSYMNVKGTRPASDLLLLLIFLGVCPGICSMQYWLHHPDVGYDKDQVLIDFMKAL